MRHPNFTIYMCEVIGEESKVTNKTHLHGVKKSNVLGFQIMSFLYKEPLHCRKRIHFQVMHPATRGE